MSPRLGGPALFTLCPPDTRAGPTSGTVSRATVNGLQIPRTLLLEATAFTRPPLPDEDHGRRTGVQLPA